MIRHHPDDALLLAYASAALDRGGALIVGAHVEMCSTCRQQVRLLQAVGGELLERIEPVSMEIGAFDRTLARLDVPEQAVPPVTTSALIRPDLPAGMRWPRSLEGCDISPWKSVGPGMRWSRITVPGDAGVNAFLLRMAAGKQLAAHTHSGRELTQVLYGAFDDGRAVWRAGDLDETDESIHHRPAVTSDDECICLVHVVGRTRFDNLLAGALGRWMGI
jgi:putative transcriptional regulator